MTIKSTTTHRKRHRRPPREPVAYLHMPVTMAIASADRTFSLCGVNVSTAETDIEYFDCPACLRVICRNNVIN